VWELDAYREPKKLAVIDTISVPKDLESDGYTAAAMGQRIIDAITQISRDAAMTRRIGIYTLSEVDPLEPESADYESPWPRSFMGLCVAINSNVR
jgi:hypothetical protein